MKTARLLLAFTVLSTSLAYAQIAPGLGSVKIGKVSPAVVRSPDYQLSGGPSKRSKNGEWLEMEVDFETKPELIDELTFKFTALVEKTLLTGEVTCVNVMKGREHFVVMYLSPKALNRLTRGRPLSAQAIEIWVEVGYQGMRLDQASFKPGVVPNLPQVPGLLLNKNETPFAPLFYDRYEELKARK